MKTILETLYNGCLYPAEQILPTSQEYCWVNRQISGAMEVWKSRLSVDNYEDLKTLLELHRRTGGHKGGSGVCPWIQAGGHDDDGGLEGWDEKEDFLSHT